MTDQRCRWLGFACLQVATFILGYRWLERCGVGFWDSLGASTVFVIGCGLNPCRNVPPVRP